MLNSTVFTVLDLLLFYIFFARSTFLETVAKLSDGSKFCELIGVFILARTHGLIPGATQTQRKNHEELSGVDVLSPSHRQSSCKLPPPPNLSTFM